MRLVHFPQEAAHHPPSQAKDTIVFKTLGSLMSVEMAILSFYGNVKIQGPIQQQKICDTCSLKFSSNAIVQFCFLLYMYMLILCRPLPHSPQADLP